MSTEQPKNKADIFSDDYDIRQYVEDLSGGQLRWLASILLIANAGLLIWMAVDSDPDGPSFPIPMSSKTAWICMSCSLLIWLVLTLVNWRAWMRKRHGDRLSQAK